MNQTSYRQGRHKLLALVSLLFLLPLPLLVSSCQDDIDDPNLHAPEAKYDPEAVISIADLKSQYWRDDNEYIDTIGVTEPRDPATMKQHPVLKGRVISSDASGNIYKSLVIQDNTGAIALSINANNLCNKYRPGQEIVLELDGMYIGKYRGLMQLGFPKYDRNTWQATFMPYQFFELHAQLNGNPEPAQIDTVLVNSYSELSTSAEGLQRWQSQLVRFNNCHFEEGGKTTFASSKTTENRTLILADGNSMDVRTSGYSNFWSDILPEGSFDMVAILSYYNSGSASTGGWQLLLIDRRGCMNVGNPTVTIPLGQEDNPYPVEDVVAIEQAGQTGSGWVTGYIVGAVAPGVQSVASNDDIEFTKDVIMDNTLVIGATTDTRDFQQCLVVMLPQDSKLRELGNLVDNPDNYKKRIDIKGRFERVLDTYGITDNRGTAAEFKIEGLEIQGAEVPAGNGSKESPYNVQQAQTNQSGAQAWVKGYIVGWVEGQVLSEGAHFTVPATSASNLLLAPLPDVTDVSQCIPVQLASGTSARSLLNLLDHPENLGALVAIEGTLEKYFGSAGLKGSLNAEIVSGAGDQPVTPPASGQGTEESPYSVADVLGLNNPGTVSWAQGVIVGWVDGMDISTGAKFTVPATAASNMLLGATPGERDYRKCVVVQLTSGSDVRKALNLVDHPDNLGKTVKIRGSLEKYFGVVGIKNPTAYRLEEGDTPVTPPTPSGDAYTGTSADLSGTPDKMYNSFTTAGGWHAENSLLLRGGEGESPIFAFLGDESVYAVCLNGNTAKVGKLTSPTIQGPLKTLSFKYGFPFKDTNCSLTINILQGGNVVATTVLNNTTMASQTPATFTHTFSITGDFVVEIVNNSPSKAASNKDRVAVWDINWTR